MFDIGLILLIVTAIGIGWALGRYERTNYEAKLSEIKASTGNVPKEYFKGLNFLLNEKPDQAVDLFAKTIDVTPDTVEIYLALGSNFRKRGEVDRAIKIHQDLLARPNLEKRPSADIQLALGQDYLAAGLLDRAERLLVDLIDHVGIHTKLANKLLITLYEQEREWHKAVQRALNLSAEEGDSKLDVAIAQYYCEIASSHIKKGDWESARDALLKALRADPGCVRGTLLIADLEMQAGSYQAALQNLLKIKEQDPYYVAESTSKLAECYEALGREDELLNYLESVLEKCSDPQLIIQYGNFVKTQMSVDTAVERVAVYMERYPSLLVLNWLLEHQRLTTAVKLERYWQILKELTTDLINKSAKYKCNVCGFKGNTLHWSCPSCKSWIGYRPNVKG